MPVCHEPGARRSAQRSRAARSIVVGGLLSWALSGPLGAAPIDNKPLTSRQPTAERPKEVLDAIKRFEAGDLDKTFEMLQAAAKAHPHLPPARVMLANLFLSDNKFLPGRMHLEQAVIETPDDPEPYVSFSDLAIRERRISDAEAQLLVAAAKLKAFQGDAKRKKSLEARYQGGIAAVAEGREQWDKAAAALVQMLILQPQNVPARLRLGNALFAQQKVDEAYQQYAEALKVDASLTPPAMTVAAQFRQRQQFDESLKWLNRAAEETPTDPRPRLALARFYLDQGKIDDAERHAQAAEKLEPTSSDVRLMCGTVARFRGQLDVAEKFLEPIRESTPGNLAASNQLALTWIEQQDAQKQRQALELATASARAEPRNLELLTTLGWVCFRLGQFEDAARHLQAATTGTQNISRDTAYFVARMLARQGNLKEARRMLGEALESQGPFAHHAEAQAWKQELSGGASP